MTLAIRWESPARGGVTCDCSRIEAELVIFDMLDMFFRELVGFFDVGHQIGVSGSRWSNM
jgi:hypothetical protein